MKIITRYEAKALGLERYFNGRPCQLGHVCERLVYNKDCIKCADLGPEARIAEKKRAADANSKRLGIEIVTWTQAKERGLKKYFTGLPCSYGHVTEKFVHKRKCLGCMGVDGVDADNPGKFAAAKVKRFRKQHPLKSAFWARKWSRDNPDKRNALGRNYRAKKRDSGGRHTAQDIDDILAEQDGKCAYCPTIITRKNKHVDHIVSINKGGSSYPYNMQILCQPCNSSKGAKDPMEHAKSIGVFDDMSSPVVRRILIATAIWLTTKS